MQPDFEMLDKVMAQVKAVAEEPYFDHERQSWMTWDQGNWRISGRYALDKMSVFERGDDTAIEAEACGTAMCMAGWTAELDPSVRWLETKLPGIPDDIPTTATISCEYVVKEDGSYEHIEPWAQQRLGLTDGQTQLLFHAGNSLCDLESYVARLKEGDTLERDWQVRQEQLWNGIPRCETCGRYH
jgi:hypothetical protein